ncbi:hypothetical protein AZI85_16245 [Bdellovibrio bacteriovorus]|uniref:Uncharacterized protein n=1 Tax=Bdellovibrio bacteriovorus TaxID=959 RepID=A0A150WTH0_BDEBC|nr:hypothetical protein AZI85_16245 [Bdellovibrio bacteriovorus]
MAPAKASLRFHTLNLPPTQTLLENKITDFERGISKFLAGCRWLFYLLGGLVDCLFGFLVGLFFGFFVAINLLILIFCLGIGVSVFKI